MWIVVIYKHPDPSDFIPPAEHLIQSPSHVNRLRTQLDCVVLAAAKTIELSGVTLTNPGASAN